MKNVNFRVNLRQRCATYVDDKDPQTVLSVGGTFSLVKARDCFAILKGMVLEARDKAFGGVGGGGGGGGKGRNNLMSTWSKKRCLILSNTKVVRATIMRHRKRPSRWASSWNCGIMRYIFWQIMHSHSFLSMHIYIYYQLVQRICWTSFFFFVFANNLSQRLASL